MSSKTVYACGDNADKVLNLDAQLLAVQFAPYSIPLMASLAHNENFQLIAQKFAILVLYNKENIPTQIFLYGLVNQQHYSFVSPLKLDLPQDAKIKSLICKSSNIYIVCMNGDLYSLFVFFLIQLESFF